MTSIRARTTLLVATTSAALLTLGGVTASILANRMLVVIGSTISARALWFALHAALVRPDAPEIERATLVAELLSEILSPGPRPRARLASFQ